MRTFSSRRSCLEEAYGLIYSRGSFVLNSRARASCERSRERRQIWSEPRLSCHLTLVTGFGGPSGTVCDLGESPGALEEGLTQVQGRMGEVVLLETRPQSYVVATRGAHVISGNPRSLGPYSGCRNQPSSILP